MKQDWLLHRFIRYKFVSYGKQRLPHSSGDKSHIKHNKKTCGIVNHFLDSHNADHSLLEFMLIDQRHGNLWECENFSKKA